MVVLSFQSCSVSNIYGLSTDVISKYGDGLPLHVACRHSLDRVKMVSVGCDVNRQDEAGSTPLHMACQNGSTDMVQSVILIWLITKGNYPCILLVSVCMVKKR